MLLILAYTHDSIGGVAGKIIEMRQQMIKPVPPERLGKVNYWTGKLNRGYTCEHSKDVDLLPGGNMSFKREVLVRAGGFDTNFGGTALFEETDISLSIRKLGYRLLYTPDAVLTHIGAAHGGTRIDDVGKQVYWYGHNYTLLFLKHFPRYTFPVWFAVRCAKFIRDAVRTGSITPLVNGFSGMYHGWQSYRIKIQEFRN